MRFGIHLGQQHLPDESAFERFKEHVEQVRLLRDLVEPVAVREAQKAFEAGADRALEAAHARGVAERFTVRTTTAARKDRPMQIAAGAADPWQPR